MKLVLVYLEEVISHLEPQTGKVSEQTLYFGG